MPDVVLGAVLWLRSVQWVEEDGAMGTLDVPNAPISEEQRSQ